jgi:hypothetical protein
MGVGPDDVPSTGLFCIGLRAVCRRGCRYVGLPCSPPDMQPPLSPLAIAQSDGRIEARLALHDHTLEDLLTAPHYR